MKKFFRNILAVIIGILISQIIFFIVLIIILSAISSSKSKVVTINDNSIIKLTFEDPIPERTQPSKFDFNVLTSRNLNLKKILGIKDIIDNIEHASTDPKIKGIFLDLSNIDASISNLEEIRNALISFKEKGKFIISYSNYYDYKSYYLASISDKIFLNPYGSVFIKGFTAQVIFYKNLIDKLGIKSEVIRCGKYKSAVEPFIYEKMSKENREQLDKLIKSFWTYYKMQISKSRNIEISAIDKFADSLYLLSAKKALEFKLIDSLLYRDEVIKLLAGLTNKTKPNFVTLDKYCLTKRIKKTTKHKIALIYACGNIVQQSGNFEEEVINGEELAKVIRKAREDSTIKAIVFRVNSPGGDALASEIIWREIYLTKQVKPVIASLSTYAASGGYYILTPADTIVTSPYSITGSIGVFALIFNFEKFLSNKIGITIDKVNTNKYSDFGTQTRALMPYEKKIIQNYIDSIYSTFINHVSAGRKMKSTEVEVLAEGRIWSGIDAIDNKLVDLKGDISEAIKIAAKKANVTEYSIVELPEIETSLTKLFKSAMDDSDTKIKEYTGNFYPFVKHIANIRKLEGFQALMPFYVDIR